MTWKEVTADEPSDDTHVLCKGEDGEGEWYAVLHRRGVIWWTSADDPWWGRNDPTHFTAIPE